jgi:hypothetical protein
MPMASRFRRVFIVCENNNIFGNITNVPMYKYRDHAEYRCKRLQDKAIEEQNQLSNAGRPLPKFKVHAFYLVHEDAFRD